jgi:hypothetical protein
MMGLIVALAVVTASTPTHTTGEIRIDLMTGRLVGSVCVENWPSTAAGNATLNTALTVARVKDGAGKALSFDSWQGGTLDREARAFTFKPPATGPVCFDYFGAAPMFPEHDAQDDFKGLIAADGKSLRATEQSVWLPAPFDPVARKRLQTASYRLRVVCDDCSLLYMNGAEPVRGGDATFESKTPREPLLFVGGGPVDVGPNVTFVNVALTAEGRAGWGAFAHDVRAFYADYLGRPSEGSLKVLGFDMMDQAVRPRHQLGFATWPTIAFGNGDLEAMGRSLSRDDSDGRFASRYIAHEMAHGYFNSHALTTTPYRWLLVESAADFMAIRALEASRGNGARDAHLTRLLADFDRLKTVPVALNAVSATGEIDYDYRYTYGPLLLESLHRTIGDARMRRFMRRLLEIEPKTWTDLTAIAQFAGVTDAEWTAWTKRCVDGAPKACIADLASAASPKP